MIKKKDKIFLAGHRGLVGSSILQELKKQNYQNILVANRKNLDLFDQKKVYSFLKKHKPKIVIIAAARVGGIKANNTYRADFIRENLEIQNNLIHGSYLSGVKKVIFLGSSCVYPKKCKIPIKEEFLLSGKLENTNEPYAIAKIAGIKMCESYNLQYKTNYLCLMPCNTFGPNDNYHEHDSHFLPAILRKILKCEESGKKVLNLWGTGKPMREVIFVKDLANAVIYFMNKKVNHSLINIGSNNHYSIKKYANLIIKILNKNLKVKVDNNKKIDGTMKKKLDTSLAKSYGWESKYSLKESILETYKNLKKFKYNAKF